ncbi:unnamed protein product, partial [Scytosiphon promiscuus]
FLSLLSSIVASFRRHLSCAPATKHEVASHALCPRRWPDVWNVVRSSVPFNPSQSDLPSPSLFPYAHHAVSCIACPSEKLEEVSVAFSAGSSSAVAESGVHKRTRQKLHQAARFSGACRAHLQWNNPFREPPSRNLVVSCFLSLRRAVSTSERQRRCLSIDRAAATPAVGRIGGGKSTNNPLPPRPLSGPTNGRKFLNIVWA